MLRPFDALAWSLELESDLQAYLPAEERSSGHQADGADMPWRDWVARYFPLVCTHPFADRHVRLWEWFEALTPGDKPKPRIEVWPRGGAKSSTGELGCCRVGVKLTRRFVLYVSESQEQADKHVQAVASLFEPVGITRALSRYGTSKGWRRDQLRTANGFNVAALGLDAAVRGVKLDQFRPDLIILDDIDGRHDTLAATKKKIATITESILPAGSGDCAILFLQNLIIKDGIVAQLYDGRAEFLMNRDVPSIEPAVRGLEFERVPNESGQPVYRITAGEATWAGQSLKKAESQMNDWGRAAFLREAQHRVDLEEGGLWQRDRDIEPYRTHIAPATFARVACAVDPSVTAEGDEAGIIVGGIGYEWPPGTKTTEPHLFIIEDASVQGSPKTWAHAAVSACNRHHGSEIVAEDNNGGEMVQDTLESVPGHPQVRRIHASRGKLTRAEPIQKLYEDGRVHHIGPFPKLESELCTWRPGDPSPNRLDALVWLGTLLMLGGGWTQDRSVLEFLKNR